MAFALTKRGRTEMGKNEHQASQWQKIIRPATEEVEEDEGEGERPGLIRRYLELADLLIKRAQTRIEGARLKNRTNHRKAA